MNRIETDHSERHVNFSAVFPSPKMLLFASLTSSIKRLKNIWGSGLCCGLVFVVTDRSTTVVVLDSSPLVLCLSVYGVQRYLWVLASKPGFGCEH